MNVRLHVQSHKLVHVSGIQSHMRASSTSGCAFVYFTVQYCIEYSSTVSLLQAQDVIYDEEKRATTQTSLDLFFKRVDRIESSKGMELVPSTSGVSEIAACPPSPIADDPSALPSPTSSPSSSQ